MMNSGFKLIDISRMVLKSSNWARSYSFKSKIRSIKNIPRPQNIGKSRLNQSALRDNTAMEALASNSAMTFPCLDAIESKSKILEARSLSSGPEPSYTNGATQKYDSKDPLLLDWHGYLPQFSIAYETWGEVNIDQSNVILLHTGLSASSHAHSTKENPQPGWWENFIGPGKSLDTDKYHIICSNVIGGCYGSTGPSSIDPADGKRYATRFPILTIPDMIRAQFRLLDYLGVEKLYATVGASMGGMQSLAAGVLYANRVGKIVSISGCLQSHPSSIAVRHTQRQVLMMDSNWKRGFYYDSVPPHAGMKLAREIATITYRSGPEWEQRFGRRRADPRKPPALCPDFLIETYLDHSGEKFCLNYDANSLLYLSKAMDLFDLGSLSHDQRLVTGDIGDKKANSNLVLPTSFYKEQSESIKNLDFKSINLIERKISPDIVNALAGLKEHHILIIGVESDILFPVWQQREISEALILSGNKNCVYCELSKDLSLYGHDTFLLDVKNIGGKIKQFLE